MYGTTKASKGCQMRAASFKLRTEKGYREGKSKTSKIYWSNLLIYWSNLLIYWSESPANHVSKKHVIKHPLATLSNYISEDLKLSPDWKCPSILFYALQNRCSITFGSDGICVIIAGAEINFQFLPVCWCSAPVSTGWLLCRALLRDITTFQAWKSLKSMRWIKTDSSKLLFLSICYGIDQEGHDNVNHIHTLQPYFHFSFGLLLLLAVKQAS